MVDYEKNDNAKMMLSSDKNYDPCLKRRPVVLIVDTSSYMNEIMDKLNESIYKINKILIDDSWSYNSIDLAIIKMGGAHATLDQEFTTIPSWQVKEYSANGGSPMGDAVDLALEQIKRIITMYREDGTSYFRPLLVMFSGGIPTDSDGFFDTDWEIFADRLKKLSDEKCLICNTFYTGNINSHDSDEAKRIYKAKEILSTIATEYCGIKCSFRLDDEKALKEIFLWTNNAFENRAYFDDSIFLSPPPDISTSIFDN